MEASDVKRLIEQGIPGARVEVTGEDAHFRAVIVAEAFAGLSPIDQHRLVYATVRDEMASQAIHALALKTSAP